MTSRRIFRLLGSSALLGMWLLLSACAQGTKPLLQAQEESDADAATGTPDGGIEPGTDTGSIDTGIDDEPDADPTDSGSLDSGPNDSGPGCAPSACSIGERLCVGQDQVATCVEDANGCGTPGAASSCGSNNICSAGQCVDDPGSCVDSDGDGYGANCASGPDCNDGDDSIHPNATELCDNVNNDCDASTDEDFSALGQSCTGGDGVCAASGTIRCDASQTGTFCDATPNTSAATVEICDNDDNDCDGQTDEAMCSSCTEDTHEPNQRSYLGTDLTSAGTIDKLVLCGDSGSFDVDWFNLGAHDPGDSVGIELTQMTGQNAVGATYPDLDVEFFCDATWCGHIGGAGATTSETLTGSCGCSYGARWTVRVYPRSTTNPAVGTPYSIRRY